jgi:hypothetical protein
LIFLPCRVGRMDCAVLCIQLANDLTNFMYGGVECRVVTKRGGNPQAKEPAGLHNYIQLGAGARGLCAQAAGLERPAHYSEECIE